MQIIKLAGCYHNKILGFQGVNDVDHNKTTNERKYIGWYGGDFYATHTREYNSDGQLLVEKVAGSGRSRFEQLDEYRYYDDGKLKSLKSFVDSYDSPAYEDYRLTEFNKNGTISRKLSKSRGKVSEVFYNIAGIAKKEVEKPGSVEGSMREYSTVERFYRKVKDIIPYRVLGKDSSGRILKEITDPKKLSRLYKR